MIIAVRNTDLLNFSIDILVNNAGLTRDGLVSRMSEEDWFRVLNVNLSGAFFCSQEALKHMVDQGNGRIIFVSSVIGEMGNIGQSNCGSTCRKIKFDFGTDLWLLLPSRRFIQIWSVRSHEDFGKRSQLYAGKGWIAQGQRSWNHGCVD